MCQLGGWPRPLSVNLKGRSGSFEKGGFVSARSAGTVLQDEATGGLNTDFRFSACLSSVPLSQEYSG